MKITKRQADKSANKIKSAYGRAKRASDRTEAAIHDPNITEKAFDALLEAEAEALDQLADAIVSGTGGAVTEREAYLLTRRRFEKIGELVARLAA